VSERQRILISPFPGSNPGTPASQPRSLRCDFLVCENRRHSGGLGWRGRVSGRQFPAFRSRSGAFQAPVSARHFPISVSASRRPVRYVTETGSQSRTSGVERDERVAGADFEDAAGADGRAAGRDGAAEEFQRAEPFAQGDCTTLRLIPLRPAIVQRTSFEGASRHQRGWPDHRSERGLTGCLDRELLIVRCAQGRGGSFRAWNPDSPIACHRQRTNLKRLRYSLDAGGML
jgi:hypothetical protein